MIKKISMCLALAAMFVGANYAQSKPASRSFTGEIMDSSCAKTGKHNPAMGTSKECTLGCVKAGGKFVLYNDATKATYQLDDQKKPEAFAGDKVKVTGTYDAKTKTIHVTDIAAAS